MSNNSFQNFTYSRDITTCEFSRLDDGHPARLGARGCGHDHPGVNRPLPSSCNTRVNSPPDEKAFVDWLSLTFKHEIDSSLADRDHYLYYILYEVLGLPWMELAVRNRSWHFYEKSVRLGEYGWLAFGGEKQNGTVLIDLNGTGCAKLNDWARIRQWGEQSGASITRTDLAYDDYEGLTVSIDKALAWREQGLFHDAGRPPSCKLIDDLGSNKGKTLYIGARQSVKCCRIYEKGKQLGDKESPWVRPEVEFKKGHREIPWEILTSPTKYFAGAYPCLAFLSIDQDRIRTIKKASELSYRRLLAHVKKQAGKAINLMMMLEGYDPSRVIALIRRDGIPQSQEKYEGYWWADDDPGRFVTSGSTDKEEVPLYRECQSSPAFEDYAHLFYGQSDNWGLPA